MDDNILFKFKESRLEGAIRWQKRALEAEGKVVELESTVSERDESIDKLIERASGYGRKAIDLETERNRLSGRVAELEGELLDVQPILGAEQQSEIRRVTDENSGLRARVAVLEERCLVSDGISNRSIETMRNQAFSITELTSQADRIAEERDLIDSHRKRAEARVAELDSQLAASQDRIEVLQCDLADLRGDTEPDQSGKGGP